MPFIATVLPAVFVLGLFTVLRLVDIAAESMQLHIGIAHVRSYYRTLGAEAEIIFAVGRGRWPEAKTEPALRIAPLFGYLTTVAIMIAFINATVAGAGITLPARQVFGRTMHLSLLFGILCATILLILFYFYQRQRISELAMAWDEQSHRK